MESLEDLNYCIPIKVNRALNWKCGLGNLT